MKFLVTLERDEAGFVVVECPALPGCLSQGRTEAEALANIREAIEASLETRREHRLLGQIELLNS
jgi:predicted RNase H-like HicB family nuclease